MSFRPADSGHMENRRFNFADNVPKQFRIPDDIHFEVDDSKEPHIRQNSKQDAPEMKFEGYKHRINELMEYGEEDGIKLNQNSRHDFQQFIDSEPNLRRGSLTLADDGNLTAAWRDDMATLLTLHFLGKGMIQFVILKKLAHSQSTIVYGHGHLRQIKNQISACELEEFLNR